MNLEQAALSVEAVLAGATARLQPSGSAALDAQLLLGFSMQRPRSWLLARGTALVGATALADFEQRLARRARGEPLAYLIGKREFWSLDLQVTPAVLVPRPETELVVERSLALLGEAAADVADLGTGSGAIALALARERPRWRVTATDRSAAALAVAVANARALALGNVEFLNGEWFEPLGDRRFELMACNPPYMAADDPALEGDAALRHEPPGALVAAQGGLADLATVVAGAPAHLSARGWLVLEHGAGQAAAVADLLVAQGFSHVRCHHDLAGLPRVTEAQWPASASTLKIEPST
ncbi:MAG TPA: peptide chain release factor N(5)-glutamine methyltransferase [Steroidobacteraceae bacterium]|nr:peptide chain release factor N(5)-glutamine methyltransferase [Steroidobacteraceae bacterium]